MCKIETMSDPSSDSHVESEKVHQEDNTVVENNDHSNIDDVAKDMEANEMKTNQERDLDEIDLEGGEKEPTIMDWAEVRNSHIFLNPDNLLYFINRL